MKAKTIGGGKPSNLGGGKPSNLKQLHDIIGMIWVIWKGIAIGSHLVVDHCQPGNHKRKNIRLFVGIGGNREETRGKALEKEKECVN
ncbi:MAG: hypothetical protein LBC30_00635 [Puniceicoccales bacterium]|jgi:hypothetical protein|nr:hypothetical protein [Puniceicoccales bacterium]